MQDTQNQSPLAKPAIRNLLMRIGLDDREADVYLALLSMKTGRATDIAKAAKQSRSHTYLILRDLAEKGLVSEIEVEKIIHFVAEPPQRLLSYLKNREQELQSLESLVEGAMPFLSSLTHPLAGKPRVTVLHGLDGVRHVYRDVLTREYRAFYNPQSNWDVFDGNIITKLFGKNVKLRGKDLLVNNDMAKVYIDEMKNKDGYEIRVLPKGVEFDSDVIVFNDSIALFTFADEPTVVNIENVQLADSFRAWHKMMWEMSA